MMNNTSDTMALKHVTNENEKLKKEKKKKKKVGKKGKGKRRTFVFPRCGQNIVVALKAINIT